MIESVFPILEVPDFSRAIDFYVGTLGGEITYRFPAEGEAVYVSIAIGDSKIALGWSEHATSPAAIVLWFYVDDVDAVTRSAEGGGAVVVERPTDMPWGERVALVTDPLGFSVRFGARIRD